MASIKSNLIDGATIRETVDGYVVSEKISVKDVGGSPIVRQYSALLNAAVPQIGTPHPSVPGVRVTDRFIESFGSDLAHVRVTWETPQGGTPQSPGDAPVWEIDSTVEVTSVQKDKDGSVMEVNYTYPNEYKAVPRLAGTDADPQVVTAEIPKATFALRIRQAENRTVQAISDDAATHVGMINSSSFLGKSARKWLCTRIQSSNPINVVPTDATYEFIFNPLTWDIEGVFVDPFIGQPPADLVDGTGVKVFRVIGESNFNNLPIIQP